MLVVLMALIELGQIRFAALRGWLWLILTGGFLSGQWGCWPVMMYGPGPDYDDQPLYGPPLSCEVWDACTADAATLSDSAITSDAVEPDNP